MKKSVLLLAMAFGVTTAFAQDLVSKKGETILPEANDWAIVLDGTPFVNFIGNSFNGNTANTLFGNYTDTNPSFAITAKLFKDAQTAYRAKVRIGMGNTSATTIVGDVTDATGVATKEDVQKTSAMNVLLGGGLEMRRGNTRLQGMYGGEAMLWLGSSSATYEAGNALSATYTAHTTGVGGTAGLMEQKNGSTFGFGVRGFVGAEYFVFSKISVGVEYGWGIGFQSTGEGETTTETWDAANNVATKTVSKTGGSSAFVIDTDINGRGNTPMGSAGPSGSVNVTLHF